MNSVLNLKVVLSGSHEQIELAYYTVIWLATITVAKETV